MDLQEYDNIAIVGYQNKGRHLLKELQESGKKVVYIIERNYEALKYLEGKLQVPIVGFDKEKDFYSKADVILLSEDIHKDIIYECIEMLGISIPVLQVE